MSKEEKEGEEMAKAKKSLLIGFAGGGALMLANIPLAAMIWFVFFFARGLSLAPVGSGKPLDEKRGEANRSDAGAEGGAPEHENMPEWAGWLDTKGIEFEERRGSLAGAPLFMRAILNGKVYEYDGIAAERGFPEEGVLIARGARYVLAKEKSDPKGETPPSEAERAS